MLLIVDILDWFSLTLVSTSLTLADIPEFALSKLSIEELTLSNCFTMNFVPDSMDEIFNYVKYGALVHKQGGK